jgi:shikimate dehydrogenase
LGLNWVYVAFPVPSGQGAAAVNAMRTLGLAGLSVTMPHKAAAATVVDRLGPVAARLGVVNTISWGHSVGGGELVGESTDGAGFIDALTGDEGFDPTGRGCVVLGTGGAARAVTVALSDAGVASVTVVGRRAGSAASCAQLAGAAGAAVSSGDPAAVAAAVAMSELVVNATPVGMSAGDGLPFELDPALLGPAHFVADLVYSPAVTPLVVAARKRGAIVANGLGMLIHQAARQIETWTGRPAPIEVMSAAALAALSHAVI